MHSFSPSCLVEKGLLKENTCKSSTYLSGMFVQRIRDFFDWLQHKLIFHLHAYRATIYSTIKLANPCESSAVDTLAGGQDSSDSLLPPPRLLQPHAAPWLYSCFLFGCISALLRLLCVEDTEHQSMNDSLWFSQHILGRAKSVPGHLYTCWMPGGIHKRKREYDERWLGWLTRGTHCVPVIPRQGRSISTWGMRNMRFNSINDGPQETRLMENRIGT